MPLRSIVLVGLRYIALMGLVGGCLMLTAVTGQVWSWPQISNPEVRYMMFFAPCINLASSACLWFFAVPIARLICRGGAEETVVSLGGLTRRDLYAFACVLMGLSFLLSSIGGMMNWVYIAFTRVAEIGRYYDYNSQATFFTLSGHAVTLLVGLALLLQANRLSNLLAARDVAAEVK